MGPVFGKTTTSEPKYKVLKSSDKFEIRKYSSYLVAEIDGGDDHEEDVATLARYIGVAGLPKSRQERFTSVEQVPAPKNPRIQIKQIPERSVAVVKFSGIATEARCRKKLRRLYDMLLEENLYNGKSVQLDGPPVPQVEGQEGAQAEKGPPIFDPNQIPWTVAEYHPYLTLPPLRRNEVWIDLLAENPALQELVAQYETPPLPRPPPQQTRRSRRWGKKKIFLPAPLPPPLPPPLPLWLLMMRTRAAVRPMLMPVTG